MRTRATLATLPLSLLASTALLLCACSEEGASSGENPGADCSVGPMPSMDSLLANPKLPDPFTAMDGNRITDKSEWLCRREEILQQASHFIYGEKPRTPTSAVSGTVSTSSIAVNVSDGGSTAFEVTIEVPEVGEPPYPAVVGFGGGFFGLDGTLKNELKSRGIAVVVYDPYAVGEETGGSIASAGAGGFYDVYGEEHPAGVLIAWAWGVSRILDVLEQDPSVLDPTRIGVAGCSRFGKGALVAGAFDARIALTIPIESGIGGTPALRLVSQLDAYSDSEQPRHAVSYQPWLSPEQFNPFVRPSDVTNTLPVDMHETLGLVAPRGLYIVDNPSTDYPGLDRYSAYVTGMIGGKIYEGLGVPQNVTYQGASGTHCAWRTQYTAPLVANLEKFLLGNEAAQTGGYATDLPDAPDPAAHYDWTVPQLSGAL